MAKKKKSSKSSPPSKKVMKAVESENVEMKDDAIEETTQETKIVVEEDNDSMDVDENVGDKKEVNSEVVNKAREAAIARSGTSKAVPTPTIPFLDTFYALASADATERTTAARSLLLHCFPPLTGVNAKDAAYAFKRLLNGLCSGRASARQGYASTLASFLKFALPATKSSSCPMDEIRREISGTDEEPESSTTMFVRAQLLSITNSPAQQDSSGTKFAGRKKGSEERDYQFGRLFGILAIVRSGTLQTDENNLSDKEETIKGYASDLIELYNQKKWMRETTAHGLITLLDSFYRNAESTSVAASVADSVVREIIIPKLLLTALDGEDAGHATTGDKRERLISSFSPEQLALAIHIQTNTGTGGGKSTLPYPLDQPILSLDLIPKLTPILSSTSSVVHPRIHLVWDEVWSYLTVAKDDGSCRVLREKLPLGNKTEDAKSILSALFQSTTTSLLLGGNSNEGTTHERRALALSLVEILSGGSTVNPNGGGRTIPMRLPVDTVEHSILSPLVVKKLFLDIITAGGGGKKKKHASHTLKPLAVHVLDSFIGSICQDEENSEELRLGVVRALLRADARFDGQTKTDAVSTLLKLDGSSPTTSATSDMWIKYSDFLERQILSLSCGTPTDMDTGDDAANDEAKSGNAHESLGYLDLLYSLAKKVLRIDSKSLLIDRILGFLVASSYFDCSKLQNVQPSTKKKKKKKSPPVDSEEKHAAVKAGLRINAILNSTPSDSPICPYSVRVAASSRFFSLLSDYMTLTSPTPINVEGTEGGNKRSKGNAILEALSNVSQGWNALEANGATLLMKTEEDGEMEEDEEAEKEKLAKSKSMTQKLQNLAADKDDSTKLKTEANTKCATGCAILGTTLYMLLLHCGDPEKTDDSFIDDEEEDEDDREEFHEFISDLDEVTRGIIENGDDSDEDENCLASLGELCVGILTSSAGQGNSASRGASSKLLREAVKLAWSGALGACIVDGSDTAARLVDQNVMAVLLDAVCIQDSEDEADAVDEDEDMEDSSGDSEDETLFSASNAALLNKDEDENDESDAAEQKDEESEKEEEEVELDPARLQSLLLEDSDDEKDDEFQLEHHEGADGALAQLIKMKRDARKVGQLERERAEMANRLRCLVLLETLFSSMNGHLENDVVTLSIMPLLQTRRALEKAIASAGTAPSKTTGLSEKKALLDRLTSVFKLKICKTKFASNTEVTDISELCTSILEEARMSPGTEHCSCCSLALVLVTKSALSSDSISSIATLYDDAVLEWSTKRTTKLHPSIFSDLIQRLPSVARIVLPSALATASKNARTFLKSESFRLLSSLYHLAGSSESGSALEVNGLTSLKTNALHVAEGIGSALQDGELLQAKRIRDVLKASEELVSFASQHCLTDNALWEKLTSISPMLASLSEKSQSSGVKNTCNILVQAITDASLEAAKEKEKTPAKTPASSKKKKKSKKK